MSYMCIPDMCMPYMCIPDMCMPYMCMPCIKNCRNVGYTGPCSPVYFLCLICICLIYVGLTWVCLYLHALYIFACLICLCLICACLCVRGLHVYALYVYTLYVYVRLFTPGVQPFLHLLAPPPSPTSHPPPSIRLVHIGGCVRVRDM